MKALVTGATGFLGGHTCRALADKGFEVTATGRNVKAGRRLETSRIQFVPMDLSNAALVSQTVAGHDLVVHSAALSSPWGRYRDFYQANVIATENVFNACKKADVKRVVHVSTPSLYVNAKDRLNIREDEALPDKAINFYAATKRLAEERMDQAVADGLSVIAIRPAGIIGPGDTAILPRLLRVAKKGFLPVIGSGKSLVDLTYVDNVVNAILLGLDAPSEFSGRKYNITNDEPVDLYETVDHIFQKLGLRYRRKNISFRKAYAVASALEAAHRTVLRGKEPLLTRYSVCAMGRSRTLNIEAAKRDLGYRPQTALSDAISHVIESLH